MEGCNFWSYISDDFSMVKMRKTCMMKKRVFKKKMRIGVMSGAKGCGVGELKLLLFRIVSCFF